MPWKLAAVVAATALAVSGVSRAVSHSPRPPVKPGVSDARIRNLDIQFYQQRTERDPRGARDFAQLAGLYLQRARETADYGDLVRAEQNARHSLSLRIGRNASGLGVLASSLLAQHRFAEARDVARRLVADDSTSIAARGLLAETQLELGDYQEAGSILGSLSIYRNDLSVAPRLARWQELHGHAEEARQLLRSARARAARLHGLPAEQLAWFDLRLGDLALRNGHLAEAERELRSGLAVSPQDYRILGTLARLEAARHHWLSAIEYGEQAIASALDPGTLGLLGEAYRAIGDSSKAQQYYRTMELVVTQQAGPFHRAWSLFLLDHDREVPRVVAKVREEIQTRKDIYGYDLLAWALHKSGDDREAARTIQRALSLGTRDAMVFYHAGMIALARGDRAQAAEYLGQALAINPYWDPFQPAQARAVLTSLTRSER
ncbi:MAG: tetratricopeptide repeat protein [Gemmatimonadales bacterium]